MQLLNNASPLSGKIRAFKCFLKVNCEIFGQFYVFCDYQNNLCPDFTQITKTVKLLKINNSFCRRTTLMFVSSLFRKTPICPLPFYEYFAVRSIFDKMLWKFLWVLWDLVSKFGVLWSDFTFPVAFDPFKPSFTPHLHRSCALTSHVLIWMPHTPFWFLVKWF